MTAACRTCDLRNEALASQLSTSKLTVSIITLTFRFPLSQSPLNTHISLNTLLNNIVDNEDTIPNWSDFTAWSPCRNDPNTVVIITTIRYVCDTATSSIFNVVNEQLARPPEITYADLGLDALSLAPRSPKQRIACDIIQLRSAEPGTAISIGGRFGWDPKRSSISQKLQNGASPAFGLPGDLIKEFRTWAERARWEPRKLSTSAGSSALSSSSLISLNSDNGQQNKPLPTSADKLQGLEEETLLMIFQWRSHTEGDRFKDQSRTSYGPNMVPASQDLWEREVAIPLCNLKNQGATVEAYSLELRTVEPRLHDRGISESLELRIGMGSRRRRLSNMAADIGEKVSRLWK